MESHKLHRKYEKFPCAICEQGLEKLSTEGRQAHYDRHLRDEESCMLSKIIFVHFGVLEPLDGSVRSSFYVEEFVIERTGQVPKKVDETLAV
jgi:hypothetical protein